jgi:hypothetical protein
MTCTKGFEIYMKENQQLYYREGDGSDGRKETEVFIKKCFPWSGPNRFLSLRDKDDNEICLIESFEDLDPETGAIIKRYLEIVEFVMEITHIRQIEEDLELRRYEVQTVQGDRTFQTELEAWPEVRTDGSILIKDVGGDLFRIKAVSNLDSKSQKILQTYVS